MRGRPWPTVPPRRRSYPCKSYWKSITGTCTGPTVIRYLAGVPLNSIVLDLFRTNSLRILRLISSCLVLFCVFVGGMWVTWRYPHGKISNMRMIWSNCKHICYGWGMRPLFGTITAGVHIVPNWPWFVSNVRHQQQPQQQQQPFQLDHKHNSCTYSWYSSYCLRSYIFKNSLVQNKNMSRIIN